MKKVLLFVLLSVFSLSFTCAGQCWPLGKKASADPKDQVAKPAASEAKASQEPSRASQKELDKMRAQRDKKRGELNNFQWNVDVTPISGKGEKRKDALVFLENKFTSDEFSKIGFQPSNYTLTIQDGGMVVVETMQTEEKEGAIFWRIEFDAALANCRGVYSRQLAGGKGEDYSFVSTAKKPAVSKPAVPKAEVKAEVKPEVKKEEGKK